MLHALRGKGEEVAATGLYSPNCRQGSFSETKRRCRVQWCLAGLHFPSLL